MKNESSTAKDLQVVLEQIKRIETAMLTTVDSDATLRSRPMATLTKDEPFTGALWFFTATASPKVGEIAHYHEVNLSYVDAARATFISISGRAQLVHDPDRARQLWDQRFTAWFPKGLDDPKLALLRVEVEKAEYWDRAAGRMQPCKGLPRHSPAGDQLPARDRRELSV